MRETGNSTRLKALNVLGTRRDATKMVPVVKALATERVFDLVPEKWTPRGMVF